MGTLGELLSVWGSKPAHLFDPPQGLKLPAIPSNLQQSPTKWSDMQIVHKHCIKPCRNRVKYTEKKGKRYTFQKWGIVGLSWQTGARSRAGDGRLGAQRGLECHVAISLYSYIAILRYSPLLCQLHTERNTLNTQLSHHIPHI